MKWSTTTMMVMATKTVTKEECSHKKGAYTQWPFLRCECANECDQWVEMHRCWVYNTQIHTIARSLAKCVRRANAQSAVCDVVPQRPLAGLCEWNWIWLIDFFLLLLLLCFHRCRCCCCYMLLAVVVVKTFYLIVF